MPGTSTNGGSPDIAILDSRIIASLCEGTFCVDVSPTVYIGSGEENVLGANVEILNPFGIIIKPYGANYEIAPGLSGGMDASVCFNIPTQANNYQYGKYTVNVKMFDSAGNSWVVTKTVTLCEPDKNNKTRNYGSLSAMMKVNCVDGKLFVIIDSVPNYNGQLVESKVLTGTLKYPTASGVAPLTITTGVFAVTLYEGVYLLEGEICATYNFTDNVFVEVKYKIKKEHNARCLLDECCVYAKLSEIQLRTDTDCTDAEKEETASLIVSALSLFELAKLAGNCGEDPSDWINQLEALLKCKCTCNCNEGAPIVNNTPSSDVIIEGCNVSVVTNGLTKTYTIENYEYKVEIAPNGGALVVAPATLENCTQTQLITFDISVVYSQIKTLAAPENLANANTEGDFWASVVNKALRDVDPACLDITQEAWAALSFPAKFTAMLTKMCACCGDCGATITNITVTKVGGDVVITWKTDAYLTLIWLDGVLVGQQLQSAADPATDVFTYIFSGAADGDLHNWILEAYCDDKSKGETETGSFQELGCPTIPAPVASADSYEDDCPYDLTSIPISTPPVGATLEYHTANSTSAATLVADPTAVAGGVYWLFFKDVDGCYSPGTMVTIICNPEGSCTAPQNLLVAPFGAYNFFVTFQSAAFPPPGNSYTVKRRLISDPDIEGSYTTIGDPVWNASLNRWVIADVSAVNNILYVYKAESNCESTQPYTEYRYANVICPTMVLYPTDTTVAYSFVPVSTATTIKVQIYDSTGTVLIAQHTYTPAFNNPTEGLFEYLTPSTTYKVRLQILLGNEEFTKTCSFQSVTTDAAL